MLSISAIGSSPGSVAYYAGMGGDGSDYYVNDHDRAGVWWGTGARQLGLDGSVDGQTFRNLLRGFSPDGSTRLVQNAGRNERRAGYDLTFSDPKSVSLEWALSDPATRRAIEAARERALHRVLEAFNDFCGRTRRGKNGLRSEEAGLIGAIFTHETARGLKGMVPDPNLHFHVVICNSVCRSDGSTGAFDSDPLFTPHMKMALGALYRAELSKELQEIGLASYRPADENGAFKSWFELSDIPPHILREFSKRRQEIEEFMNARGFAAGDAKSAEKATLHTRHKKVAFAREELFQAWKMAAAELGFDVGQVEGAPRSAVPEPEAARWALERALDRITGDRAHFSRIELIRYAAEESQTTGVGIDQLLTEVDQALSQSNDIVRLTNDGDHSQFTTREMFQLEEHMLSAAHSLYKSPFAHAPDDLVNPVLEKYHTIRAEQAAAVRHITQGSGRVACVNGMAGTGKTFMLKVASEIWKTQELEVLGTSLAAKACQQIEKESGIASTHLARLFFEISEGRRTLSPSTVVVLDEAGMVGTRQLSKLIDIVTAAGAKVVMIGDARQLQAIEAGSPFRGITRRIGCVELREITRQRDEWARESVMDFALGDVALALQQYHDRGQLVIGDDREKAMAELVRVWDESETLVAEKLIFAATRLEVAILNRLCQQMRVQKGELGADSIRIGSDDFRVGDRIIFRKNNASLLVRNGTMATITSLDSQTNIFRATLDTGLSVTIQADEYDHVRLGYAITVHSGQGVTVEESLILVGGPMTDRELTYVQASRARGRTMIFTDMVTGGPDIEALAKQIGRSRAKNLAHDLNQDLS